MYLLQVYDVRHVGSWFKKFTQSASFEYTDVNKNKRTYFKPGTGGGERYLENFGTNEEKPDITIPKEIG
jgi:hypothetical protein